MASAKSQGASLILELSLGILTAVGGFVDIGELVFCMQAGAQFRFSLLWVLVLGTAGIIIYGEMCGRIAAVIKKPVFELIRERMGFFMGLLTLITSAIFNLLTCAAEIGGIALVLRLLTGLPYPLLLVMATLALGGIIWF